MRNSLSRLFAAALTVAIAASSTAAERPLSLVVMDPLAAPLSCPCVKGYAQRKYEALAKHLQAQLGREVRLTFSESLKVALNGDAKGEADLIVGKHSVVLSDAAALGRRLTPVASLTGKDGLTTQTGLIVVPSADPAQQTTDLQGYRLLFGPQECEEKHQAAVALLRGKGVQWAPGPRETCSACSDGATKILAFGEDVRAAAVISSYAQPLLQGCGTIKKGDLRVVGETAPVPFVTAFVSRELSAEQRQAIEASLLDVGGHPGLCKSLETLVGFLPWEAPQPPAAQPRKPSASRKPAPPAKAAEPATKKK